jgi:hypothetical protein
VNATSARRLLNCEWKESLENPTPNKIYKVVSFAVPSDHIEWHFEKTEPDQLVAARLNPANAETL